VTQTRLISGGYDEHGAYGPTIFMRLHSEGAVNWLKSVLLDVAHHRRGVDLVAAQGVSLQGVEYFELSAADRPQRKRLSRVGEQPRFIWVRTPEEWRALALMLDPFLEGSSGHQYLSEEGIDDALVEVSFDEANASSACDAD
jgi:hypothetical protein